MNPPTTYAEALDFMRRNDADRDRKAPTLTIEERRALRACGFRPVWTCADPACRECGGVARTWHRADLDLPAPSHRDEPADPEPPAKPPRLCAGCGGSLAAIDPKCSTCFERAKKRDQRKTRG